MELCPDISVDDFIDFDAGVDTCEPSVNGNSVSWREDLRDHCIQSVIRKNDTSDPESSESEEDENEDENIDLTPEEITSMEALDLADRLQTFFDIYDVEKEVTQSIMTLTDTLEKMRVSAKSRRNIKDFFP